MRHTIAALELVDYVAPIQQLRARRQQPDRMLERQDVAALVGPCGQERSAICGRTTTHHGWLRAEVLKLGSSAGRTGGGPAAFLALGVLPC